MEYIIIGDLHGDINIFLNIVELLTEINLKYNNKDTLINNIKKLYQLNYTFILLGDIFDCWHEKNDIKFYEYNEVNNTNYSISKFEEYKEKEYIRTYNYIRILKEYLKEKLILILGNHDIRYYKKYDLSIIEEYNNEIIEYLNFIKNNFCLNYIIDNKINCIHNYKFNKDINILQSLINLENENIKNDLLYISNYIENKTNINKENRLYKLLNTNNQQYIYIFGHSIFNDKIKQKINICLDNRMSKFKYDINKCSLNNCFPMYIIIKLNPIEIIKYNNNEIIYQLTLHNKTKINFFNNIYLNPLYNNNNLNIDDIIINNINKLIDEYKNKTYYFNQSILNTIYNLNKKLNVYNFIINYNKIMNQINNYKKSNHIEKVNIKYFDFIFDKNLNVIGNIQLKKEFLLNINNNNDKKIGGNILNEINDNYKILKQNIISNTYYIGKNNYKSYVNDIINNYNYLMYIFNNFDIKDEKLDFDNDDYKKIVYYIYLTFYNYKLTDEDIINFNNCNLNIYNIDNNINNIINNRIFKICYALDDIQDKDIQDDLVNNNIKFNNVFEVLVLISKYLNKYENLINYELIYLCYKIFNNEDLKTKNNLINILINKLKTFNTQNENEIKFVLNNMYEIYDDKFYNDDFKLNYISQFNIYALYFIYQFNYNDELNKQIKLFLNL